MPALALPLSLLPSHYQEDTRGRADPQARAAPAKASAARIWGGPLGLPPDNRRKAQRRRPGIIATAGSIPGRRRAEDGFGALDREIRVPHRQSDGPPSRFDISKFRRFICRVRCADQWSVGLPGDSSRGERRASIVTLTLRLRSARNTRKVHTVPGATPAHLSDNHGLTQHLLSARITAKGLNRRLLESCVNLPGGALDGRSYLSRPAPPACVVGGAFGIARIATGLNSSRPHPSRW